MPPSLPRFSVTERALARVGTVVQKYRIDRLLGIGGMAAVYAATHRNGHRVAMKFLLEHLLHDSDIYRLFSREAYVANQVGHPGAVSVLDDDIDEDGCVFLVMPLLEGETLRARWERKQRRLELAEVGIPILDVLDVLAAAHAKGIVHRDIKPDNLFVTTKGEVRVLDFGIARRVHSDGSTTITGRLIGTPAFIPPEQALGERTAVGPHSDVWAVGATIFALLSGEFVHRTSNAGAQLAAAATRIARSLVEVVPGAPASIVRVVDKALAFDAADRWASAKEMREALVPALEEALGEPLAATEARVRAEIVADLMPNVDDVAANETQRSWRDRQDAETRDREPGASREASDKRTLAPEQVARPSRKGEGGPTIMAAGVATPTSGRKRTWISRLVLAIVAFLALGSVFLATRWGKAPENHNVATLPATAAANHEAETSSNNPEALAQLKAGIQNWRDTSRMAAEKSFTRAIQLDPNLAEPNLYLAMQEMWTTDASRAQYQAASALRNGLRGRDLALLEAYAPAMEVSPDLELAEQRLVAAREKFPSDWLVLHALALMQLKKGKLGDALQVVDDLLRREPSLALAWMDKGVALGFLDDVDGARAALNECVRISSQGEGCLRLLVRLDTQEGRCSDAERNARKLIALPYPLDWAAINLSGALYGRGAPIESVRDVLARAGQLAPESRREIVRLQYETQFDVLTGAFASAQRASAEWSAALANEKYEDDHARFSKVQFYLAMELGDRKLAARLASDYLARREAWLGSSYYDWEILALRVQYLTGGMPGEEFERRRQVWLDRLNARPRLIDGLSFGWTYAYALAVATPDDAEEAIHALPNYLPITDALTRDAETDDGIGNMYLVAGDIEKALPFLRRGAASCQATFYPFEQTWANLHFAMALERIGDSAGACKAYNVVLSRWGKESRSISANTARKRSEALHCARFAK